MQDVLEDESMGDWVIGRECKSGVVLHDRLMTDALGAAPIKTEHSYSLHSDVDSPPQSPHTKVDGFKRFQSGNFDVKDEPRSGRPVTIKGGAILEKIEQDWHINSYDIAEELKINYKTVLTHLTKAGYTT
ncbi:Cyclic AMP response element-binding protein A [Eumeta japonica]|uniref:Cyclic AMP response element-binding protein A n=1 Tax=Eumeta variegata TaxID=151549 RepID=A0A4C1WB25_EUMVA|nr:Cyclic AMP response element-binding protein A [Eumeta japonica]